MKNEKAWLNYCVVVKGEKYENMCRKMAEEQQHHTPRTNGCTHNNKIPVCVTTRKAKANRPRCTTTAGSQYKKKECILDPNV
jgi:hypothetical protein